VLGEPYLTRPELARHLHVSGTTVKAFEKRGLPRHKWGRMVRYRVSEVDCWLRENVGP
jgi:hypothetical protein